MTTIAYRAGIIAGDGRETFISEGESAMVNRDDCVKVHRLPDGRLFGAARTSEDIERLYRALVKGRKTWPKVKCDDVNAMVIDLQGKIWCYEGRLWIPCDQEYAAVGSGSVFALAAMDAGATAEQAVKVGVKRDPYSGGKITVLKLKT
jgi:ATP-dependent protease HslVU (ClpYQ) peptidase subunit